jgi:hypothetical protein
VAIAALASSGALAARASAADEAGKAFVNRLRNAVAGRNTRVVAAMFRYPVRVNAPLPFPIPLNGPADTTQYYDLLFTPEMRCVLELAQVPVAGRAAPKYPLLVNGDALTLGDGYIVAERTAGQFKITRFSIFGAPAGRKAGTPVAAADIDMRFRGNTRQVAGLLAGDAFDRYTISLTKGTMLIGRLERFRGLDAVFRVTDKKGKPVDAKADGRRTWAAAIPESGDYRIEIVRNALFCDPPLTYLLTLIVK